MAANITLRLAWHNNGWNGRICLAPHANTFCSGRHSYPGDLIASGKDTEWESSVDVAGKSCAAFDRPIPCALSCNAFGSEHISAFQKPPVWFYDDSQGVWLDIPPATACIWPYESMYSDDVVNEPGSTQTYDYDARLNSAKSYFTELVSEKSIIVYYTNYSNPFSEEENQRYIIVGISRLKSVGEIQYYDNISEKNAKKYAGGFVWQMPITSTYPDEGFYIPYDRYADQPDILEKLAFEPENPRSFKYATRKISDDDLINVVERFISIVDVLVSIKDDSQNWQARKEWLIALLSELWQTRGAYPGFPQVLQYIGHSDFVKEYLDACSQGNSVKSYKSILAKILANNKTSRKIKLLGNSKAKLLTDILPRFSLTHQQIESLIDHDGSGNSITADADGILKNPYLLCEQYIGSSPDDTISFYQIDNGVLPSPEYGIESLFDADSAERFRALCVDALTWENTHSFSASVRLLELVNLRTSQMRDWRQNTFNKNYFEADEEILSEAVHYRKSADGELYLYLNEIYEDERLIKETFESLADRPDIRLTRPVTVDAFVDLLSKNAGELEAEKEYQKAILHQAEVCSQVFAKGLCVISGSAGTGKTTLIQAIITQIEKTDGIGANVVLLAPTGKATERIREKTNKTARTIHSFLAGNGWQNDNRTFKRRGGRQDTSITTVIVDESSMIDLSLFAALVRSIKWSNVKRLILVGDPNQLPPIGRGKVFSDTIEWVKTKNPDCLGVLTHNIRQLYNVVTGAGRGILDLAEILIQEKQDTDSISKSQREEVIQHIQTGGSVDKDLFVEYWKTADDLKKLLEQQLRVDLGASTSDDNLGSKWSEACDAGDYNKNPSFLQVISPFRGNEYGTDNLNSMLQGLLNPYWSARATLDGITYFDKVIQITNHTKSNPIYAYNWNIRKNDPIELFNGEMGFSAYHALDASTWKKSNRIKRFTVKFKGKENYSVSYGTDWRSKPIENLELGYAISVHKSQGSEFDIVYAIIPKRKSSLLSMELLYTAVTRAQKKLVLFIQEDVSTLSCLTKVERSAVRRINSSVFNFKPLPPELSYLPNWYEEYKIISTLSEYFVRSKSEALIANTLHMVELDFYYEKPLFANDGTMYLPDFTVIFRGEEYYWEHLGRLDLTDYESLWKIKSHWYKKHFPGKLLTTHEGNDLSEQIKQLMLAAFEVNI